ncbi:YceG family protein [Lachnospiraceae bacterium 45-W7]
MFEHKKIQSLQDFFVELNKRREQGVYFCRINGYNEQVRAFIQEYYQAARRSGVVIEGKIPNPDEKHLAYYGEIMGMDFQMNMGFLTASLKKWLPRMYDYQRNQVAASVYDSLDAMRKSGKNENMQKNAYIKFMCWLYYKFERIVSQLGDNKVPKILYEGQISNYELMLISILSHAGCDVVLLQYQGDQSYRKLDPSSGLSEELSMPGLSAFPTYFNLKWMQKEIQNKQNQERLYGVLPESRNCTNAWIQGKGLPDVLTDIRSRGEDSKLFYNCLLRINGVEDKLTYQSDLYQFQQELKKSGRRLVILEEAVPRPTMEEIGAIRRKNYADQQQMLVDLAANIQYTANQELQRLMHKAFLDILLEESNTEGMNLNRLTNKAVYLLCWLRRYQSELFCSWKLPEIACFIYLGGCKDENEAMFFRFLARLPVDVVILVPNRNQQCVLEDGVLYEINYPESLAVTKYPRENGEIQIGTAAYHAERELDSLMYQDSGMYRNRQFGKAVAVTLRTMYEEIAILWDQELKYRPNFSTVDDTVNMPVIFAKVSGVKDQNAGKYWSEIKGLITKDTLLVKQVPYVNSTDYNPVKAHAAEFFKNGKVQKTRIRAHPAYPYGVLREEIQEHILEKLQVLIDMRTIRGTFENGTEYTIVSTVLNLKKEIVHLIQKFDFTRKNPKIIYINPTEKPISLEDSIITAFLNLVGFDVVFFVPTGYQSIEQHFNHRLMEEHQVGDYLYDLQVPEFASISSNSSTRQSWRERIFKRGT